MRYRARFATSIGLGCLFLLASYGVAVAAPPGEIVLGSITVFRLRVGNGKLTLEQRGDQVQDRLTQILAIPNLREKDVSVQPTKYGPTIYVHGIKLLTVDEATAKASNLEPLPLAKMWAHRLAGILPQVNIRLPAGTPATSPAAPGPAVAPTPPATETPVTTPETTEPVAPTSATPMPTPSPTPETTPAPTPEATPPPAAPAPTPTPEGTPIP